MVNFKSKSAYEKWLAYGHIHKVFTGSQPFTIKGKVKKVKHGG